MCQNAHFGLPPRRCVRMAKMQGAEDEGAGSVQKYMTKPESDSNAADWLLWHTAHVNILLTCKGTLFSSNRALCVEKKCEEFSELAAKVHATSLRSLGLVRHPPKASGFFATPSGKNNKWWQPFASHWTIIEQTLFKPCSTPVQPLFKQTHCCPVKFCFSQPNFHRTTIFVLGRALALHYT